MNGIILVDKPHGWTSHDVVAKLRGILREKRIGHSGTLDPLATGLLVAFAGRATRAVEFAGNDSKEYIAGLRLGLTTDTQDISGCILSETDEIPDEAAVLAALKSFTGTFEQLPPMYSAVKVNGKRLYELARRGETAERKPRSITIHSLDCLGRAGGDYILRVKCSKGTYIRTLCGDIGEYLGCGGCMSSLRRVACGRFSIEDAHRLEEISDAAGRGDLTDIVLPTDKVFEIYPALTVEDTVAARLKHGSVVKCARPDGEYRVYAEDGEFLLLGRISNGRLITIKSFFEVSTQ